MQMKCDNCKNELSVVEENILKEEDQKKCREAIQKRMQALRKFDNYVVPANFFGEGNLSAYVSPTTT